MKPRVVEPTARAVIPPLWPTVLVDPIEASSKSPSLFECRANRSFLNCPIQSFLSEWRLLHLQSCLGGSLSLPSTPGTTPLYHLIYEKVGFARMVCIKSFCIKSYRVWAWAKGTPLLQ